MQRDLDRLQATCRVCMKSRPRGRWEKLHEGLTTLEAALDLAVLLVKTSTEAGIFLEHPEYDGLLIWTSKAPELVNDFGHLGV